MARRRRKQNRTVYRRRRISRAGFFLIFSMFVLGGLLLYGLKTGQIRWEKNGTQDSENQRGTGKDFKDHEPIRVVITTDGQGKVYHKQVQIRWEKNGTWTQKKNKVVKEKGDTVTLQWESQRRQSDFIAAAEKGRVQLCSVQRQQGNPFYHGSLRIHWTKKGFIVINRVPLRQYLYSVVSSEMDPSAPEEALKAQAVCARSYAWKQRKAGRYSSWKADIDDTTACQVYNNIQETAGTRKAVRETDGQVLHDGKTIVTAYYYSTSWGCSASNGQVWGSTEEKWYPVRGQNQEEKVLDLSEEKTFAAFLQQQNNGYDADGSWYRWNTVLDPDQIGRNLGIGCVQKVQILKRASSGILQKIRLTGTKGRKTLYGQQEIREKLSDGCIIEKQDGTRQKIQLLPSAAFYLKEGVQDGKNIFLCYGGGFGHGVGMSQVGACKMAEMGNDYREILKHYFAFCEADSF